VPAAGDLVGKWKLERPLGEGASATVWLAHLRSDPMVQVAIKLIRPSDLATYVDRLAREAELLRRLDHPSIVKHRGSGSLVSEGLFFLVMDKVDGEDLHRRLATGPLPAEAARRLFRDLASALRYAHGRGVFHRDLKPSNVFVRPDGGGCLIDFGIALQVGMSRLTAEGMMPGTVSYMPPELFRPGAPPDPALGDVYALGLMMYEALTGRRAFEPRTDVPDTQAVMLLIQKKGETPAFDPGPQVPQDLRTLVQLATEPDPELRVASMERFAERLGAAPLPAARGRSPLATMTGTRWLDDDEAPGAPVEEGWTPNKLSAGAPPPVRGSEARPPEPPPRAPVARAAEPRPTAPIAAEPSRGPGASEVRAAPPPPPTFSPGRKRGPGPAPTSDALVPNDDDLADDADDVPAPPTRPPVVSVARQGSAVTGSSGPPSAPTAPASPDPLQGGSMTPRPAPPRDAAAANPARRWLPLIVGAALLAGSTMILAVAALAWVMWEPSPGPPPPPQAPVAAAGPRTVDISVAVDVAVWLDGARVPTTGAVTSLPVESGPHKVHIGVGSGCGPLPEASPCCTLAESTLDLPAGDTPFPWSPEVPTPAARTLQLTLSGPAGKTASVWVDDLPVEVTDGVARSEQLPGSHTWRVEAGTCPEAARGCADANNCPPGCVSHMQGVEVVCGPDVQRITVNVPEPIGTATTTPPTPKDPKDPKEPKPPKPPKPVEDTLPPPPDLKLVADVTVTARTVDKAGPETTIVQAGMAAQTGRMKSCFEGTLGGKPSDARVVTVEFKTDRAGVVDTSSVRVVGSSGVSQVDGCATAAVKSAKFSGTKKAGMGKVVVRFAAELR
jgi:serine/threonine protein kinase